MSSAIDDYFLALAAATPLPTTESTQEIPPLQSPTRRRPQTRSQTSSILQGPLNIQLPSHPSTPVATKNLPSSKKRKPNFTIFVDADASSTATPARRTSRPKRSRTSSTTTTTSTTPRTPLSDRTYSSNSTPAPSPRLPDTPFTFSPEDPYWENIENYSPFCSTGLATPPVTPSPSTSSSPPPPSSNMVRSLRPRTPTTTFSSYSLTTLIPPANMLVYNMLGLSTWRVTPDTIASAYRRRAASLHPDKTVAASGPSGEREKELATLSMQQLVAARDLLLDRKRRGRYHRDGVVPWVI